MHKITIADTRYPPILKQIADPPQHLFLRGELIASAICIAVVGPRQHSAYGAKVTEKLVYAIAKAGVTIVSGLARGIDGIAHQAALQAKGKTVAVLGSGCDDESIYPKEHVPLAHSILSSGGALISEYQPGSSPTKLTFPARNRIIAGMAKATLVIEAAQRSGSLITARCALDYDRDVLAVPQNIDSPTARGVNELIRMGAYPVTSPRDVLFHLGLHS